MTVPAEPVLQARDLRRRYGRWQLALDSLALAPGETLALLGPNGAGKSTLLHLLALVERPDAGAVILDGVPVRPNDVAARRRLALVMQQPLLLDGSVARNVALGMRLHGLPRGERERRTRLWMERTGVLHLAGRRARSLSGGEQRRVSLARALALSPLVLFLDEPFAALDAPARRDLLTELPGWLRAAGCATVLVTHDRDDALALADRAAVLLEGRLAQIDAVTTLFSEPASAAVAAFLGIENILTGELLRSSERGSELRIGGVTVLSAARHAPGAVTVTVDQSMVRVLAADQRSPDSDSTRLVARVQALEPSAGGWRVRLDAGFPLVAQVSRALAMDLALELGATVAASLPDSAVHVMPAINRGPA